ncbi:MAG: ABC transporter permease [Lachnospiraceae bacterium]|nr:ABC transporter permease [Lachnospiraceae bacterium]
MAGKSGRTINATPENVWKKQIFSWEGILVIIFIAVIILCKILSPNYTFTNVLREMPKYLSEIFLLFPMAYILLLGEIDISVGSIVCLSATAGCLVSNAGVPFGGVVIVILLTGTICGAINGAILVKFPELPSMIVTLGTQIVFRGIAEIVLGSGGSVSLSNTDGFRMIAKKAGPFPYVFFLVIISAVIFTVISVKMKFGRSLYAIGSNRQTAFYSGIRVKKVIFTAYTVMGLFAGIAALFLTSALYGANTTTGKGFEMDAIAMAVFGGIATTGGKGRLVGGVISAFIIICLRIGLGQINMNSQLILVIIGILLICAVLLPNITGNMKLKKKAN